MTPSYRYAAASREQLAALTTAAEALSDCMAEFPGDPSIWSEDVADLDDALARCPGTADHARHIEWRDERVRELLAEANREIANWRQSASLWHEAEVLDPKFEAPAWKGA